MKKRSLIVLLGCAIPLGIFPSAAAADSPLLKLGIQAYERGDNDAAIEAFTVILSSDPRNSKALLERAFGHLRKAKLPSMEHYERALRDVNEALLVNNADSEAKNM